MDQKLQGVSWDTFLIEDKSSMQALFFGVTFMLLISLSNGLLIPLFFLGVTCLMSQLLDKSTTTFSFSTSSSVLKIVTNLIGI